MVIVHVPSPYFYTSSLMYILKEFNRIIVNINLEV
jgi:hypothetical protein